MTLNLYRGGSAEIARLAARLTKAESDVEDLMFGRLGFKWYFAYKQGSQAFAAADFDERLSTVWASEFPETAVENPPGADYFSAFALPLDAPVLTGGFTQGNTFMRRAGYVVLGGDPFVVYVSRYYVDFGRTRHQVAHRFGFSDYQRAATISDAATYVGKAPDDPVNTSNHAVVRVPDFEGSRYLHFALANDRRDPAVDLTHISLAAAGAPNLLPDFTRTVVGATGAIAYSSDSPVDAATYSGQDMVLLPDQRDITYYEPPTDLSPVDVGFTWYMGYAPYLLAAQARPFALQIWKATDDITPADFAGTPTEWNFSNRSELLSAVASDSYLAIAHPGSLTSAETDPAGLSLSDLTMLPGGPHVINGRPWHIYVSNMPLDHAVYGTGAVRLNVDHAIVPDSFLTAAHILSGRDAASSTTNQIAMPADADGGTYRPAEPAAWTNTDSSIWQSWVPFLAQPLTAAEPEGIGPIPDGAYPSYPPFNRYGSQLRAFPTYEEATTLRANAEANWPASSVSSQRRSYIWRRVDNVDVNGVAHAAWLLSRSATSAARLESGARMIVYRPGDGFGE